MERAVVADTSVGSTGTGDELWSQASTRHFRIFRDQHGREWGADCEIRTNHPCGPVSPHFDAPLTPPEYYLVIVDTVRGLFHIHYDRWIEDLRQAHLEYEQEKYQAASDMYADKAAEAVAQMPTALRMRIGPGPHPLEPVLACAAGNPWMLGEPGAVKPKAAEPFFPEVPEPEYQIHRESGVSSKKYEDPFAEGASSPESLLEFPNMYAPGRWYLDAQHMNQVQAKLAEPFQGDKQAALAEIEARRVADPFQE